ncbi:MAG: acetyl-CoA carboxylase biotin carboxyl carrier protein subunit [Sphingobacteriales bacterium]|nr:acetyl-CoA carboxylase biotin carboxyl carrier protein subunit [Sphingobacteriales bacterium]
MYKVNVNNLFPFSIEERADKIKVNNEEIVIDSVSVGIDKLSVLVKGKVYQAEIVKADRGLKTFVIKISSNTYTIVVKDKYDELLHNLGLDEVTTIQISDLKAPMPGMVLKVFVNVGDLVKQGDSLLTLEAMKMENIIKAPADVVIKMVSINPSDKVERNQVLMTFE